MAIKCSFKAILTVLAACALLLGSAGGAAAGAAATVTWDFAASNAYRVANDGTQSPTVTFNPCLRTNTSYTINFAVTVASTAAYNARFATVGEDTQLLTITFTPTSVSGSGTRTFTGAVTFRTLARETGRLAFPILLEENETPLDTPFPAIVIPCVTTTGTPTPGLPNTGGGGMAPEGFPGAPAALLVVLLAGAMYGARRRRYC